MPLKNFQMRRLSWIIKVDLASSQSCHKEKSDRVREDVKKEKEVKRFDVRMTESTLPGFEDGRNRPVLKECRRSLEARKSKETVFLLRYPK